MPCCKADEFGWCKELETITAPAGREYCIFHAPSDCPGKQDVQTFNNRVFSRIEEAIKEERRCELGGTIFPGDFFLPMFSGGRGLPAISFKGAMFGRGADFKKTIFGGKTDFFGAIFNGTSLFQGAIFKDSINFIQARFEGEVDFLEAEFNGMAYFRNAVFHMKPDFWGGKIL